MATKKMAKKPKQIVVKPKFIPHKYQYEMFEQWKRFNVVITCRGWGKTVFAVMALDAAARNAQKPTDFGYICPVKAQAWDVISPVIYEFLGHLEAIDDGYGGVIKAITIKDSAMEVHYSNGSKFKAYGADHPNNKVIRGKTFGGVVIDEFDDTDYDVWLEIISPCLRGGGWALFIGTVKPGSNLYRLMEENADDPDWNFGVYKFEDCWEDLPAYAREKYGTSEYDVVKARFKSNPNKYAREYQCDPSASDDDVVITTELIYEAEGKHVHRSAYERMPKVMGIDVATGNGGDSSSICKRQGLACLPIQEYNLDNMAFADVIAREIDSYNPDAVFIDKGRGEGVISRLRQMGYSPIGVDFGGSAIRNDIYRDRRVEMYHSGIRGWLEMGGALPSDKKLIQELAVPCLKPSDSKFVMERKVDIKKKLGRSPDKADALALTFASPVRKRNTERNNSGIKTRATTGYHPLDNIGRRRYGAIR
jgi:hypothetical protein